MGVDLVQGVGVQAVGQYALDGVQAIVHAGLHLIPVIGGPLSALVGLVL
jgi:hypothetical protein